MGDGAYGSSFIPSGPDGMNRSEVDPRSDGGNPAVKDRLTTGCYRCSAVHRLACLWSAWNIPSTPNATRAARKPKHPVVCPCHPVPICILRLVVGAISIGLASANSPEPAHTRSELFAPVGQLSGVVSPPLAWSPPPLRCESGSILCLNGQSRTRRP